MILFCLFLSLCVSSWFVVVWMGSRYKDNVRDASLVLKCMVVHATPRVLPLITDTIAEVR